jgi:hypothetical protein
VTPEALAARHPKLFHVTVAENLPGILAHGLLPTARLLDLFDLPAEARVLHTARRAARVHLAHPAHGEAWLTDNTPLSEAALAKCLDDMTPAAWLARLNAHVFLWASEQGLASLSNARANRGRALVVLECDTLGLARAHAGAVALSPINSGSTLRKPARRGLATFVPLAQATPSHPRRVREVVVQGGVAPITPHLLAVRHVQPG